MNPSPAVAPEAVEAFRRDGAVCIRGAFSVADVALAEVAIERNLAEPSEKAIVGSRPDDPGRFFEDFCNWQRLPELELVIRSSPAAAIAGELMGADKVRFFHDHVLVKEPGTTQRTSWHQDLTLHCAGGVDGVERRRALSLRFLGDDVTHAPREWTTSPDFPGLADELAASAPLDHPLFPIVWERNAADTVASSR